MNIQHVHSNILKKASLLIVAFFISSCTISTNITGLDNPDAQSKLLQKKISFDVPVLNITEGSAAIVSVQLSDKLDVDTEVQLSIVGDSTLIQSLPASLIIPAGSLSISLTIQTIEDLVFKGSQSLQILLTPKDSSLVAEPNTLTLNISDNDLPTITITSTSQTVSENVGTVTLAAQINAVSSSTVTVPITYSGSATVGLGADLTMSSTSIIIPAGQTQGTIILTINDDAVVESTESITFTLGTPINAVLGSTTSYTLTILDNDVGVFSISGITGGADVTADGFLATGVLATVNWATSAGASSYDVTIYAANGTTVVCPTQNVFGVTIYNFSACTLTGGVSYKASVIAKIGGLTQAASNDLFSFYVNRPPIAGNDGPIRIISGSGVVTLQVVTASDSATRGTVADSDPDFGDTLAITAVTQGAGGTVTFTSSTVSYTPSTTPAYTGVDTFTYTLSDNHGATATGTVTIHNMTTYTWTGKASANWNVNGNWCGTISNNQCVGTTGYPNSTATAAMVGIFDGTCSATGHTCDATLNVAISAYGVKLNSGYTGALTQGAGGTPSVSIGAGGFKQASGTFVGSLAAISFGGPTSITGGSFTANTGTLTVLDWTLTDTPVFNANGGTVYFSTAGSVAISSGATQNYSKVTFSIGSAVTLSGTMNILGQFTVLNTTTMLGGTVNASGNISITGWAGGSTTLNITGSANQTVTCAGSAYFPSLSIQSTGGTVSFNGQTCRVNGNYTYVSGTMDLTGSTIIFYSPGSQVITGGSVVYNNISLIYYTKTISGTLKVGGTLTLDTSSWTVNGGTIEAYGDVVGTSGLSGGTTLLKIMGSLNQAVSCGASSYLPSVEIASTGGNVTLGSTIGIGGALFRYTSGNVISTGSTVMFMAVSNLYPNSISLNDVIFDGWSFHSSLNGQTMNVLGKLYQGWNPSNSVAMDNGTFNVYGGLQIGSQTTPATATINIVGAANQTISGTSLNACSGRLNIASTGGTVTISGNVAFQDQFIIASGNVDMSTAIININNNTAGTISVGSRHFNKLLLNGWSRVFDLQSQTLYVDSDFSIGTASNLTGTKNGTIEVTGNVTSYGYSAATNSTLKLKGCGQTITIGPGNLYSGFTSITSDQSVFCATASTQVNAISLPGAFTLLVGNFSMGGFNLTAGTLFLNSNTLTKGGGVLTVGGSPLGTGSLNGGTVNP